MNKTLLGNLLQTILRYRLRVGGAIFMVILSNGLLILNPLIFRQAIIALSPQGSPQADRFTILLHHILGSYFHSIYGWAFLLLLTAALASLLRYTTRMTFISMSREVEMDVRSMLFDRIQAQSKAFFDHHGVGDLLSRLSNDITAYRDVLGPGLMYPLFFITLLGPAIVALFSLSPSMALISLLPIVMIYLLNLWIRPPLFHISQKVQESLANMSTMAHEHYSGIRLIKGYAIEKLALKLFNKLCKDFTQINLRLVCIQGMILPLITFITKGVTIAIVIVAGANILLKWGTLSVADFLSFMWIQSYIFGPMLMLGWVLPMYQRGRAAYARLVEIYEEPIEVYTSPNSLAHIPPKADIVFHGLTFTYPKQRRPALSHVNLTIKGGSFVGITGPVGSGKTTLFRLLNREYEVPRGKIAIGGKDIHDYSLNAFHKEIVTVEQIPFLFSKSIADNVRFGKHEATQEELEVVVKQVDLHDSILDFPEQYNTVVGERGVSLSGGQKQRVAIARAFLVNRSILLLDDIFSAVDAETEKRIFEAMRANFVGKTLLLITHRVSILEQMDRLLYFMNGHVVEDGSPTVLAQQEGHYQALVDLQKMTTP